MADPAAIRSREIRLALELPASPNGDREYRGVSSDSRSVAPGQLFVALPGARVDGAEFLPQAAEAGAVGAIVAAGREDPDLPLEYFPVDDPLVALGRLAGAVRRRSTARVIAITGSSGKTTVKEMIALAVSPGRSIYRTEGNLNSQVGLPLTILRAPAEADTWVLEIGASEPGEIAKLTAIAAPHDAVVTTVGPAHLEAFGDEAGVLREKLALARGASPDGALVVGELPPTLPEAARAIRSDAIVAGLGPEADYRPDRFAVEAERISFERNGVPVTLAVGGEHHLRDALLATALAESIGVSLADAAGALAGYRPVGHRGAVRRIGALTVLADCYNANPESFRAAIAQCRDLYPGRRLAAFVGSMLELGPYETSAHAEVARDLSAAGFSVIAATGAFEPADFPPGSDGDAPRVFRGRDPDEAWPAFAEALRGDEVVLVKASRGARLEIVLERLASRFGEDD